MANMKLIDPKIETDAKEIDTLLGKAVELTITITASVMGANEGGEVKLISVTEFGNTTEDARKMMAYKDDVQRFFNNLQ